LARDRRAAQTVRQTGRSRRADGVLSAVNDADIDSTASMTGDGAIRPLTALDAAASDLRISVA
jgi:hypothetical protein